MEENQFYNLSYSQEARAYIFAFLFAVLSFLFFVKLVKSPSPKQAIGYAVFTLCLLYSHYYDLFALAAQIIPGVVFIFQKKGQERKKLFRLFFLSAAIIAICYAPWIPFLRAVAATKSFWIGNVDHAFLQNYFSEFFGNSQMLKLVLVALLVVYLFKVVQQAGNGNSFLINDPLVSSFFIFICWVFVAVLIPYVRSLVVLPMLIPRYTIIILPAILMAVAYGIELSGRRILKHSIIVLIVVLSLINILLERKYYSTISKTQFREMTEFLVERNKENYPIINELIAWPQAYYLKKYKSTAEIFGGPKGSILDSILSKSSPKYNVAGFWLVGAHGDKMPDATILKNIDTSFFLIYQK